MAAETSVDVSTLPTALVRWLAADAHHGLFVTDTALRIVLWNRWMEVHSGRTASEVYGRTLFDVYPDAVARGIRDCYDSALRGQVTVLSHGLHRFLIPLSPTHPELALAEMPQSGYIGPLLHEGQIVGSVTTIDDVSDRLASERELRRQVEAQRLARATAEKALHAKDEFLSTLSHEIRTPLNAVLGWARILLSREHVDRDLLTRALTVIERNASLQAKMIDDMLDMARIVAGKLRLERQSVDLLSVVLAAVDVMAPAATAKRIAIRTTLDPATPPVLGDQDRLQQVVWNLLSNAVKFTDAGGTVDVRLSVSGVFVSIVVQDTGHGIPPEFLPHVFDRFRQSDASSTRRQGGLGLGLGLVLELVELHGGVVRAESDGEGHGSTFTIQLPMAQSRDLGGRPTAADGRETLEWRSLAGVRVLLIEDEPDARDMAMAALEHCGAKVTAVSSGAEGLSVIVQALPNGLPQVIVSDIGMPHEDGYALIRHVRSLEPGRGGRIPAVAVTGYAAPDDVDRALAAGYQMHFSKPVDPSALIAAIARLVTNEGEP